MDDPVLARAKLLLSAMNGINNANGVLSPLMNEDDEVKVVSVSNSDTVRASAIHGSTLLSTHTDIRNYYNRGDTIIIDGAEYRLKERDGEWAANCLELSSDYSGDTNFEATVTLPISKIKKSKKTALSAQPVSSDSIRQAVEGLPTLVNLKPSNTKISKIPKAKVALLERPAPIRSPRIEQVDNSSLYALPPPSLLPTLSSLAYSSNYSNIQEELNEKNKEDQQKAAERVAEWRRQEELKNYHKMLTDQKLLKKVKRQDALPVVPIVRKGKGQPTDCSDGGGEELGHQRGARPDKDKEDINFEVEQKVAANEFKIALLRDKTQRRVAEYKERVQQEQQEAAQREIQAAADRHCRAIAAADKRKKLVAYKRETEERLNLRAAQEEAEEEEKLLQNEKRLKELARVRCRQFPTADLIHGLSRLPLGDKSVVNGTGTSGGFSDDGQDDYDNCGRGHKGEKQRCNSKKTEKNNKQQLLPPIHAHPSASSTSRQTQPDSDTTDNLLRSHSEQGDRLDKSIGSLSKQAKSFSGLSPDRDDLRINRMIGSNADPMIRQGAPAVRRVVLPPRDDDEWSEDSLGSRDRPCRGSALDMHDDDDDHQMYSEQQHQVVMASAAPTISRHQGQNKLPVILNNNKSSKNSTALSNNHNSKISSRVPPPRQDRDRDSVSVASDLTPEVSPRKASLSSAAVLRGVAAAAAVPSTSEQLSQVQSQLPRKKKKEVWRQAPIPVRPFIAVPPPY